MANLVKAQGQDHLVMISKNNEEYGSIMLIEHKPTLNEQSFLTLEKRVGFIKGKVKDLNNLISVFNLSDGSVYPGVKLIVREAITPFFEGQEPKINPETSEIITDENNNPVYRYTYVVSDTSSDIDVRVKSKKSVKVEAGSQYN